MKFSTRKDIEAPIEFVFGRFTDFSSLERQAMRRGMDVKRLNPEVGNDVGAKWVMKVPFRGKERELNAELIQCDAPSSVHLDAKSGGLKMHITLDMIALSPSKTRLTVGYDVRPETLSARILVQSVKFAKNTLQRRFEKRIGKFCDFIESQYDAG